MFRDIADNLTAWHARQQRELPWRSEPAGVRDAYAVWVSEVMAQQTQLTVVVDYYNRWMEWFPSVEDLAGADQQEVLKLWEGLGYYSRARNLHRAAQIVADEFGGRLPRTRRELLQLPGIGEYTAGAILSLAFGQAEPILDANAKRVFSRVWDIDEPIEQSSTEKRLWQLSRQLVDAAQDPGTVNEGLMELGALLCRPRNPRCRDCPLRLHCSAHRQGVQNRRPVRRPREDVPHIEVAAAVIWEGAPGVSRLLISQRPEKGLLGGLWSFPNGAMDAADKDLPACLERAIRQVLGVPIDVGEQVASVEHGFTHFRMTLSAFHARICAGKPRAVGVSDWRWTTLEEIEQFPCPVPDRKIILALRNLLEEV